jgi:hypothetical protein
VITIDPEQPSLEVPVFKDMPPEMPANPAFMVFNEMDPLDDSTP